MDKWDNPKPIDFTVEQAREILRTAPLKFRNEPNHDRIWINGYLLYNGQWYHICRTDKYDDVCTHRCFSWVSLSKIREALIKSVRYGARLPKYEHGELIFSIVDSMTDG